MTNSKVPSYHSEGGQGVGLVVVEQKEDVVGQRDLALYGIHLDLAIRVLCGKDMI